MTITWKEIAENATFRSSEIDQYEEFPMCPFCQRGDEYRFAITLTCRETFPMYPTPQPIDSADIKNMVSLSATLECTQCGASVATVSDDFTQIYEVDDYAIGKEW